MGSSNTENYNNNDFYSYKRMTWHIHTTLIVLHQSDTKSASNMQRIAQLLRRKMKLETVINIKGNFRRF